MAARKLQWWRPVIWVLVVAGCGALTWIGIVGIIAKGG